MSKEEELVPIARITGAHGIKGEVKAAPYGDLDDMDWKAVFLVGKGGARPARVTRVRRHKGVFILELDGVADRNAAEALSGFDISVRRSDLPETAEDEYYYFELVGMDVYSEDSKHIGRVSDVMETGSNDVLVVDGPHGEVLVPAIEQVIVRVDPDEKKITIRLIEGILPEE
ncbi:MAG: 16S rRNA processing protein RimM [Deltaproteobacteria bacterium]|nr:16S rRNA processing protein RimM [Deltaproteobacteria bacterium]MBZ0219027.1 ribosome maturation factor RimM [Deltaproteobacteria bacterium]